MSSAKFSVFAALDGAGGHKKGTVIIDRATGMFLVRPYRSQQTYAMPLGVVATMVCAAELRSQVRDQQLADKAAKAGRG